MRVLVTGMIAGMDDRAYLQNVVTLGQQDGVAITLYDLIASLESTGNKKLHRLLGATNYLFEVLREREYRKIGFELQKQNAANAIIRAPATIEWNRINVKLKDHNEIGEYIRPDVVVTLIDAEWRIRERFRANDQPNPFFRRIKEQNHTIHEILSWMNEEVSLAEDWANYLNVRHYVIPLGQNPRCLYKLITQRNVPSFYVSYCMTHADPAVQNEIDAVVRRLSDYGLVIDPQAIEIGSQFDSDREKEAAYAFTVHRDLHWFVGKVDAIVAIHPYGHRPPLSTGMMDELGHARDYLKRRYMIFPPTNLSPFTTESYIEHGHIFNNSEEFFLCLEAEGFRPLGK